MIHSLKLRHWKSHESSRFEFSRGTNLLIGPMGAGKTSVLDAICFALFGTFPALKSRRVSLDQVLMARPERKGDAMVELSFETGGQKYTVTRSLNGKGSEAYLRRGDQVIEGPQPIRTTEAVQNTIRLDYELFTRAIYAEQNKVDHFLTLAPRERKKQIDELLGLDAFESARTAAVQAANRLKAQRDEASSLLRSTGYEEVKRLAAHLEGELAKLHGEQREVEQSLEQAKREEREGSAERTRLEGLEARFREAERKVTALEAQLAEARSEAERGRKALATLPSEEEAKGERERLMRHVRELEAGVRTGHENALAREKLAGRLETLAQERKAKQGLEGKLYEEEALALQKFERERESLERKLEELRSKTEANQGQAAQAKARGDELAERARERASLQEQLKDLERRHGANLRERLAKVRERALEFEAQAAQALARGEEARKAHEALASSGAGCPVCEAPLGEERRALLRDQKNARHRESLERHATLEAQLREARAEGEELERAVQKVTVAEERLAALAKVEEQLQAARAEEKRLAAEHERLKARIAEAQAQAKGAVEREERQRELVRGLGELAALLAQEAKARTELERLEAGLREQSYERLEGELKAARERLNVLERVARVHELQNRGADLERELTAARGMLAKVGFKPEALARARTREAAAQRGLAEGRARQESMRALEKEKTARLGEAQARVREGRGAEEHLRALEGREERLALYSKALVETQTALRAELIEGINEGMALLWKGLYPYRDYTAVRLSGGEDDYEVEIRSLEGAWVPIEQASGGERSCAALSLRIAFAMVLAPQLSWLVLDEPTHNLDANAVLLLGRALRDEIPGIVDQVFIITHDEALKESASARVYRIERDKDRGDKSVVEEMALATAE